MFGKIDTVLLFFTYLKTFTLLSNHKDKNITVFFYVLMLIKRLIKAERM